MGLMFARRRQSDKEAIMKAAKEHEVNKQKAHAENHKAAKGEVQVTISEESKAGKNGSDKSGAK